MRSNQREKNGFNAPRGWVISRIASRPPGRRTRRSSTSPARRSATFRTPKPTVTTSKLPSAKGSASTSPSIHSIELDLRRARASICGREVEAGDDAALALGCDGEVSGTATGIEDA